MHLPRTAFAFFSLNIKKVVSVPIMASNRISDPDSAEQIIRDGYADMVNLGRVLIADPQWPLKAFDGRVDELYRDADGHYRAGCSVENRLDRK